MKSTLYTYGVPVGMTIASFALAFGISFAGELIAKSPDAGVVNTLVDIPAKTVCQTSGYTLCE